MKGIYELSLIIMAAGMGSRYGGLKQIDSLGPNGEILMEYAVYDAIRAGFSKVIFVIRKDFENEFKDKIGNKESSYSCLWYQLYGAGSYLTICDVTSYNSKM